MQNYELNQSSNIRSTEEYNQCTILWRNLPSLFKTRWRSEAERLSMSGYRLFINTNVNNLIAGDEIKIAPWH
jgi:spore coat polysaccharide biosynthesis protein SpsF (cytidylyltransferase family)